MKILRDNRWVGILAVALAIAAAGGVGQPRAPSLYAALGGPTIHVAEASDFFLEIEGVEGESAAPGHRGQIEILSWSWGVSQTTTGGGGGGGGAGAGRTSLGGHVTLIKRIDKASPLLFKRCVEGTVVPRVIGHLTRADGQTYLKYELKEVMVSSISHGDVDGDGVPEETLELALGGTKLTHTQFDAAGKPVGQTSAEW